MLIASFWLTPLCVWGMVMMEFGIQLKSLELENPNLWKFWIGITSKRIFIKLVVLSSVSKLLRVYCGKVRQSQFKPYLIIVEANKLRSFSLISKNIPLALLTTATTRLNNCVLLVLDLSNLLFNRLEQGFKFLDHSGMLKLSTKSFPFLVLISMVCFLFESFCQNSILPVLVLLNQKDV